MVPISYLNIRCRSAEKQPSNAAGGAIAGQHALALVTTPYSPRIAEATLDFTHMAGRSQYGNPISCR
jgi:hypothetical protein